jgi:hypothetical protein
MAMLGWVPRNIRAGKDASDSDMVLNGDWEYSDLSLSGFASRRPNVPTVQFERMDHKSPGGRSVSDLGILWTHWDGFFPHWQRLISCGFFPVNKCSSHLAIYISYLFEGNLPKRQSQRNSITWHAVTPAQQITWQTLASRFMIIMREMTFNSEIESLCTRSFS